MAEIRETAVSIDHDTGRIRIDTRDRGFAGMCRRAGLVERKDPRSGDYAVFVTDVDTVKVTVTRRRRLTPELREAIRSAGTATRFRAGTATNAVESDQGSPRQEN